MLFQPPYLWGGIHVCGGMFDQAAGVHLSSSSAVYRLCAVPTGCSGGLCPCVWRGAEGRLAPGWGSRTGAAGTVLLPQERAVQTAWRSGRTHSHTHPNTKDSNTQTYNKRHEATHQDKRDVGKMDETRQDRQKAREGGRVEGTQERSESRHKKFSAKGKSEKQRGLWERQRVPWKPMKKKDTWRGARRGN